jgi:hypothetical protein
MGIINGYEDNTFRPENEITRAELVKILTLFLDKQGEVDEDAKSSNLSPFSDVGQTYWARSYINVGKKHGFLNGYPDNTFKPQKNITFEEALAVFVRIEQYSGDTSKLEWPQGYVDKAKELNILQNVEYRKGKNITRGEVALIVNTQRLHVLKR